MIAREIPGSSFQHAQSPENSYYALHHFMQQVFTDVALQSNPKFSSRAFHLQHLQFPSAPQLKIIFS